MSVPSFDAKKLRDLVSRFHGRRIAVLGDLMLDRYLWGRIERISPEAPVPVVEVDRETSTLGGAGNVAANLSALGARPMLFGAVGHDDGAQQLLDALAAKGVESSHIVRDPARPTTLKTRIVANSQHVVRFDLESREPLAGESLARLIGGIATDLGACEGLIVSDYGKGVVIPATLEAALKIARERGFAVSVDPKESHIDHYQGVSLITPNQNEAGWVQGKRIRDEPTLMEVGWGLQKRLDARCVLVTRGAEGMSLFERGGRYTHLPTVAREVFDVTGAGDTVVSVAALALAVGADFPEACTLANHAAGVVIREIGTASCSPAELLASLDERA
jgi:D-beta-D-heptose 7-phosphate kinase/D-beta-D-heptose 1-phosphate adenosyltransferase